MTIPSIPLAPPPTDNLYKFLTIGGLTWMIVSSVFVNSALSRINREKRGALDATISVVAEARSLESVYGDTIQLDKGQKLDQFELTVSANLWRRTQSDTVLRRRLTDLENRVVALNLSNEQSLEGLKEAGKSGFMAIADGIVALFATALGFWAWYTQHQRHQDELLQLQLRKARHEAGLDPEVDSSQEPSLGRWGTGTALVIGAAALAILLYAWWEMWKLS